MKHRLVCVYIAKNLKCGLGPFILGTYFILSWKEIGCKQGIGQKNKVKVEDCMK